MCWRKLLTYLVSKFEENVIKILIFKMQQHNIINQFRHGRVWLLWNTGLIAKLQQDIEERPENCKRKFFFKYKASSKKQALSFPCRCQVHFANFCQMFMNENKEATVALVYIKNLWILIWQISKQLVNFQHSDISSQHAIKLIHIVRTYVHVATKSQNSIDSVEFCLECVCSNSYYTNCLPSLGIHKSCIGYKQTW